MAEQPPHILQTHAAKIYALEQKLDQQQQVVDELKDAVAQLTERRRGAAEHPAAPRTTIDAATVQTLYSMYDSTFTAMKGVMSNMSELASVFRESMDKMHDLVGPIATAFTRSAAPAISDGTIPASEIAQLAAAQLAATTAVAVQQQQQQMPPPAAFGPAQAPFPA